MKPLRLPPSAFRLLAAALLLCCSASSAQTRNLAKTISTGALTEGFATGSQTITLSAAGTFVITSGATITGTIPPANLGSGSSISTKYLRGDGTWQTVTGSTGAGDLTGTTLAANVVTSSLTSVGVLTGGSTGAGFTVALDAATITGTLSASRLPATAALTSGTLAQFAATTSAQLRSLLSDESGTGAALFAGGNIGDATATTINGTTISLGGSANIFNIAVGSGSLGANAAGHHNTAMGQNALGTNNNGSNNTAVGNTALFGVVDGINNTAMGLEAGLAVSSGSYNVIIGDNSGGGSLVSGSANTILGSGAAAMGNDSNSIVVGFSAVGLGDNTTVIGNNATTGTRLYGTLTLGQSSGTPTSGALLLNGSSSGTVTITAAAAAGTYAMTLPTSNASGVLTNNGTGTLTWAAAGTAWGAITGTLSAQTDLNSALALKAGLTANAFSGPQTITTSNLILSGSCWITGAAAGAASITFFDLNNYTSFDNGTVRVAAVGSVGFRLASSVGYTWSSSTDTRDSSDTGLFRVSAGIVKLANGTATDPAALQVWGTSSGSKYLSLAHDGTNAVISASSGTTKITTGGLTVGTNGSAMGTIKRDSVTLVAGTATVSDTDTTANSVVIPVVLTPGGTRGHLDYDVSAGASYTVNSDSATDTSTVSIVVIHFP